MLTAFNYVDVTAPLCLCWFVLKVDWHYAEIAYDDDDYYYSLDSGEFSSSSYEEPVRVRREFPETWLWFESSAGYRPSDVLLSVLQG